MMPPWCPWFSGATLGASTVSGFIPGGGARGNLVTTSGSTGGAPPPTKTSVDALPRWNLRWQDARTQHIHIYLHIWQHIQNAQMSQWFKHPAHIQILLWYLWIIWVSNSITSPSGQVQIAQEPRRRMTAHPTAAPTLALPAGRKHKGKHQPKQTWKVWHPWKTNLAIPRWFMMVLISNMF